VTRRVTWAAFAAETVAAAGPVLAVEASAVVDPAGGLVAAAWVPDRPWLAHPASMVTDTTAAVAAHARTPRARRPVPPVPTLASRPAPVSAVHANPTWGP